MEILRVMVQLGAPGWRDVALGGRGRQVEKESRGLAIFSTVMCAVKNASPSHP